MRAFAYSRWISASESVPLCSILTRGVIVRGGPSATNDSYGNAAASSSTVGTTSLWS